MDGDEASEITDSTGAKGNKKGSAPTTPASDTKQPPEFKRAPEKPSNLFDDAVEVTSEAVASMNVGSKPQTRKGAGRRRATIPDETLRILIEKWLHQVPPDSRVHCPIFSKQQNWHLLENRGLIVSKNETCPNRVCIIGFPPNNAAVRYIKEWYMSGVPFCMLARLDLIGMRCLARVFDQYGLFVHLIDQPGDQNDALAWLCYGGVDQPKRIQLVLWYSNDPVAIENDNKELDELSQTGHDAIDTTDIVEAIVDVAAEVEAVAVAKMDEVAAPKKKVIRRPKPAAQEGAIVEVVGDDEI
jgi:hypothetical protein